MIYARFLRILASTLQQQVQPHVGDPQARHVAAAAIRALAAMATALDTPADDALTALDPALLPPELRPVFTTGAPFAGWTTTTPPENLAARGPLAPAIAAAAGWLDRGDWCRAPALRPAAEALAHWEKSLLDGTIETLRGFETAVSAAADTSQIDPARLETYLRGRFGAGLALTRFNQAIGGRSRQTALFSVTGAELPADLVIQRTNATLHTIKGGIGSEFPLLVALHKAGLKVPRPILMELSPDPVGGPFMIVERAPGGLLGDYFDDIRSATLPLELAEQMALLHQMPARDFGATLRSSLSPAGPASWAEELAALRESWHRRRRWPSITVSAALAWLADNIDCIQDRDAIVHGDMVFHNVLVEDGRLSVVLDWEHSHIGHPGEDLGYCRPAIEAMIPWDDFLAAYRRAGGPPVSRREIDYFSLTAILKLLTLIQDGREASESFAEDIMLIEGGTSFLMKLHHRLAIVLEAVLRSKA